MNHWTGIGRLTADPKVSYISESQTAVCKFNMAIDDGYGEKKRTNFIPVTVFGKQAENCERYLAKGKLVAVEGKITTGSYTNKDGQKVYTTDVVASRVEFIDWKDKGSQNENQGVPQGFAAIPDDEFMPFC